MWSHNGETTAQVGHHVLRRLDPPLWKKKISFQEWRPTAAWKSRKRQLFWSKNAQSFQQSSLIEAQLLPRSFETDATSSKRSRYACLVRCCCAPACDCCIHTCPDQTHRGGKPTLAQFDRTKCGRCGSPRTESFRFTKGRYDHRRPSKKIAALRSRAELWRECVLRLHLKPENLRQFFCCD